MKIFKSPTQRSWIQLSLLFCFLLLPVSNLPALIFTTNCPTLNPSLPLPKRITSGCDRFGALAVLNVNQFTSGTGLQYSGVAIKFNPTNALTQYFYLGGTMSSSGAFTSQFAMTNGGYLFLLPSGRLAALQYAPPLFGGGYVPALGVYTVTGAAISPVFEKQLDTFNLNRVNFLELANGSLVLSLNNSNSVVLLGLTASGGLNWRKELTSAEFPSVVPARPSDLTHYVQLSPIGTSDVLLHVTATEYVGTTNTAKSVFVRVGADGAVQSAQKINIPLLSTNQTAYAGFPVVTPAGEVLIYATDYNADFTPSTILAKLGANGVFLWGRRFAGLSLTPNPQPIDSQGSILLSSGNVFCILDAAGQVTSLAQVNTPGRGSVTPTSFSTAARKIYYAGTYTTNASAYPDTGIIGSSSLTLSNFVARKYVKMPVTYANLFRLQDERVAFSGSDASSGAVDLVFLNSDLVEQASCQVFEPESFVITTPSISVLPFTQTVANISVQSSNLNLGLIPTQLSLERMVFSETDLCSICSYSLSSTNVVLAASGGSTNVSLTVLGPANCAWTVVNPCPGWLTVSPTSGTGSRQVTISASASPGGSRNCTVTIADQSFTVTQASDILALASALDATDLVWTTGGNSDWSGQNLVTHDGVDAGQSGSITNDQESWMETTVVGPGTLTFWWKVSSEAGSDRLRFLINGSQQNVISGEVNWQQKTYSIAAGSNVLRWRYTKDFASSSGQDRGWVDQVVWTPTSTCSYSLSSNFESLGPNTGSTNVSVTVLFGSSCAWTVLNPCTDWLTVSPMNGTGNGQVAITVSANTTGIQRNCSLTVADNPLFIFQDAGATCLFSLSSSSASIGPSGGSTNVNFTVVSGSNCAWTAANPCPNWITVSPTNGTGNGQLTITVSTNNTGSLRACTLTVGGAPLTVTQTGGAPANMLAQYNPTGSQSTATPLPPSNTASNVTASGLGEVGLESWLNTDIFPVGRITTSPNIDLSQYLTFTVSSDAGKSVTFQSLLYDKQSYTGAGPTHASIRSSLDAFAADVETLMVNPAGFESLVFDLSKLPPASGPVTFRIYFYGAPSFTDWADLVSTGRGGNGLRLNGAVNTVNTEPLTIQVGDPAFGFANGHFGFNLTGPQSQPVVIEFSTNLQTWTPIQTNLLGAGALFFSDPQSGFSAARFYRGRLQ